MPKLPKIIAIALFLIFGLYLLGFCQQEQITITTYYPSPYGSYRELSAHRMKVGRNYSKPDRPVEDDNLVVEGSVGIGTTAPSAPLHIKKKTADPFVSALFEHNAASFGSALYFYQPNGEQARITNNSSGNTASLGGASALAIVNDNDAPIVFATADTEKMRITGQGRVCIGRDSPRTVTLPSGGTRKATLDIDFGGSGGEEDLIVIGSNTSDNPNMILNKGNGVVVGNNGACDINFNANGGIGAINGMYFFIDSEDKSTGYAFHFRHNGENKPATDDSELMVIEESGNVGIGTTNPATTLEVRGSHTSPSSAIFAQHLRTPTGNNQDFSAIGTKNQNGLIASAYLSREYQSGGVFQVYALSANARSDQSDNYYAGYFQGKVVIMDSIAGSGSGKVGIGTNSPNSTLQVVGDYVQIPVRTGNPPAADCNSADDRGRMVIAKDQGKFGLWFCTNDGWHYSNTP